MEYVAVSWRTANMANDEDFVREKAALLAKGWKVTRCAPWSREGMPRRLTGGACIMQRSLDEPRMWTEAKLRQMMQDVLAADRGALKPGDIVFVDGTRTMIGRPMPSDLTMEETNG